jgi:hypothetical protein
MIVCGWCRKALIERFRDEMAMHSLCKGCLVVHTVCDYCLAKLVRTLGGEAVTGPLPAESAARPSRPYATVPATNVRSGNEVHTRRHETAQSLSLPRD